MTGGGRAVQHAVEIEVNSSRERTRWMEEPMELLQVMRESESQASRVGTTAAALAAALGLAVASWVVAVRQMNGMDNGVPARLARVLCRPVGVDDAGDDAAGRGPGSRETRSCRRRARRAAVRRDLPGR